MNKKRIFIIAIITLCVAGGIFWYLGSSKSADVQYRFEKIQRGDLQVVVTATGTLSAVRTVQVGTQVSGTIQKLFVDFNSKVRSGQVIALIDPTFLAASVRDAEANSQGAKAHENESQRAFERTKILLEKGLASQADYDAALTTYESASATRKQADAQLERANINLRYATIKAPIDGVVISRAVDIGQTVAASLSAPTIYTIANDLTKMQVQANIDESDIGRIKDGQDVIFTVDAYPEETFHGKVSQIRLASVTVQNVVNYTVIIDVPNIDLKLMPGMTATVTVQVTKTENVLKVPTVALRFQPPKEQIDVKKDSSSGGEDSARAARRRQFAQQGGGGAGTMDMAAIQRRMAARGIGKLYVLNANKKLESISVKTGLSDGTYTEIVRGKIEEGQDVVVGITTQKPQSSSSPIPMGGGGGGGRRGF